MVQILNLDCPTHEGVKMSFGVLTPDAHIYKCDGVASWDPLTVKKIGWRNLLEFEQQFTVLPPTINCR